MGKREALDKRFLRTDPESLRDRVCFYFYRYRKEQGQRKNGRRKEQGRSYE